MSDALMNRLANQCIEMSGSVERSLMHQCDDTMPRNIENDVSYETINNLTYYEISGYGNYEDDDAQKSLIGNAAQQIVQAGYRVKSPLCVLIKHQNNQTSFLFGMNAESAKGIIACMTGRLPDCSATPSGVHPDFVKACQKNIELFSGRFYPSDDATDRFVRACESFDYMLAILASPISDTEMRQELHNVQTLIDGYALAEKAAQGNAMIQQRLQKTLGELQEGSELLEQSNMGLWKTCVWGATEESESIPILMSQFCAAYASNEVLTKDKPASRYSSRVFTNLHGRFLDDNQWKMLYYVPEPNLRLEMLGNQCVTVMGSDMLSAAVSLPRQSIIGFSVRGDTHRLAPAPRETEEPAIMLGRVENAPYRLTLENLRRHVFVTGQTQMGKTNTVMNILLQVHKQGVPFIVLEGSKKEYNELRYQPGLNRLQVLTTGIDGIRIRMNLFEPEKYTTIQEHAMAITDLFGRVIQSEPGSPIPMVVRELIRRSYERMGWNTQRDVATIPPAHPYPTFSTMLELLPEVLGTVNYGREVSNNVQGATLLRIMDFCNQIGDMNSPTTMPIQELLETSAVVELDNIRDEGVKGLICGFLAIRVSEHMKIVREANSGHRLKAILVLEEAHAILPNQDVQGAANTANYFSNMLAEVSNYGLGIIVADQSVSRVDENAIRNTAVKITHSLSDGNDIKKMQEAMASGTEFGAWMAGLQMGEALVRCVGNDGVAKVAIDLVSHIDPINSNIACLMCSKACEHNRGNGWEYLPLVSVDTIQEIVDRVNLAVHRGEIEDTSSDKLCYAGNIITRNYRNNASAQGMLLSRNFLFRLKHMFTEQDPICVKAKRELLEMAQRQKEYNYTNVEEFRAILDNQMPKEDREKAIALTERYCQTATEEYAFSEYCVELFDLTDMVNYRIPKVGNAKSEQEISALARKWKDLVTQEIDRRMPTQAVQIRLILVNELILYIAQNSLMPDAQKISRLAYILN